MTRIDPRFVRFVAVGLFVTLIDLGLTYLVDRVTGQRVIAVTTGFAAGLAAGYLLHARISFAAPLAPTRQIPRLLLTVAVNYLLTLGIVEACARLFGASTMTGKLISLPVIAASSYLLSRYWVYAIDSTASSSPLRNVFHDETKQTSLDLIPESNSNLPSLKQNIFATGILQIFNYAIPLITIPYLTRVLGTQAYGTITYIQVLISYIFLITDFGFSWIATRKIAARRHDKNYVSAVFLGTWGAQWLLVTITAFAAAVIAFISNLAWENALLFAVAFLSVIGNILFPTWYLQGLERLRELVLIQVLIRLFSLIPLFTLIQTSADAIGVLAINGCTTILGGLIAIYWISKNRLIEWYWPTRELILRELSEAKLFFNSRIAVSAYTTLAPLVLGWVEGPVAVGYFGLADKLRTAAQSLITPISQAMFPRMSHLFAKDTTAAFILFRLSFIIVVAIAGCASFFLYFFADWLIEIFGGGNFAPAAKTLQLLAFLPLIVGLSNLFGVQLMLPKLLNRQFNKILTSAGIIGTLIVWPLVELLQTQGAALTVFLTELFVTSAMAAFLWRSGHLKPKKDSLHEI